MTDKEYKHHKSRIKKFLKKWYKPAGFSWWDTDFVYSRERSPDNDELGGKSHADWEYSHASITFYLPVIAELSDKELEHMIVHELCHLPASNYPNFEDNSDAQARFERTVDDFAKHLLWAAENVNATESSSLTDTRANTKPKSKLAPRGKDKS